MILLEERDFLRILKALQLILAAQSPDKVHIMAYEEKISEKRNSC